MAKESYDLPGTGDDGVDEHDEQSELRSYEKEKEKDQKQKQNGAT